jgi:uncharacterized protein
MKTGEKLTHLKALLKEMGEVTVAYSGGVDSTFLLKVATDILKDKAMGVLAVSPTFPSREYDRAIEVAESFGASLKIIDTNELEDDNFVKNPVNCLTALLRWRRISDFGISLMVQTTMIWGITGQG